MYDKKIKWKNIFAEKQPKNVIKMIKEYAYFFKSHHIEVQNNFFSAHKQFLESFCSPYGHYKVKKFVLFYLRKTKQIKASWPTLFCLAQTLYNAFETARM